ncbi:MAG: hypothetical protein RLZZ142_260 [Verrucomicrobiota bacterium]|jgi:DNA-binding transcriptional LysR family regulator
MYIQTLQVFSDVVGTGSFSKAAERNGISQSAVSQQVRALERELGVELVERRRSGVVVSEEGRVFLEACGEILGVYRSLPERLAKVGQGMVGRIRIASVYSIGLYELPGRLEGFRLKHPGVALEVEYGRAAQVYAAVLEGRVDVGLVAFPKRRPGLGVEVFDEDELVLICAPEHPLAGRGEVGVRDLVGQRFIAFEPDLPTRKAVDGYLREAGVRLLPYLEFDNVDTVKQAVRVEGALSILPRKAVEREVAEGRLVSRGLSGARLVRPLGVLYRKEGERPVAWRAFLQALCRRGREAGRRVWD